MKKKSLLVTVMGIGAVSLSLLMADCGGGLDTAADSGSTAPLPTVQDDFPNKAIEITIPYSPGGSADLTTRLVAQHVHKYLPVGNKGAVVINKPGGGGILAMSETVASEPDGYNLGVSSNGVLATTPLQQDVNYDFNNVDILMHLYTMPSMAVVAEKSPWKTGKDLIEYVQANPGQLKLGILGVGNAQHIAWLKLCKEIGSSVTVVPFKGATDLLTAIQQGMIDACQAYPLGDQKDGVVELWSFSSKEPKYFPGTPTIADIGYPNAVTDMFFYFFAPTGMPENRRTILIDALTQTLKDEAVVTGLKNMELDAYYESGEWCEDALKKERESSKPFLEELGLLKQQQASTGK